jgi:aminopeptidase-like protein
MSQPDQKIMMELMERLWPLHRTLVSDDMDRAIEIIGEYLPEEHSYTTHEYPTGQKIWTWSVPEKYEVDKAYLEYLGPNGPERIVDFADNPLHIVSYGPAFEGTLSWGELESHLHTNPDRPKAIPWVFKFYDRDWGFCLPHDQYERLDRNGQYRAVMKTRYVDGTMKVGELDIPGETDDYILIVCAICHPCQVNDSISGVAVAVDYARRLTEHLKGKKPGPYGIKVLFLPETVGSIAYLSNNEDLIERFKFGIFTEFVGHDDTLRFQRTRQDDHRLDKVVRYAIDKITDGSFKEGPYCHTIITNDEKVTNAPGVNIPTVAINRWPGDNTDPSIIWPFYHTSDDKPSALNAAKLSEVSLIYDVMMEVLQKDFFPRRTYRGPLFLSGLEWEFDWKANRQLKQATQNIMFHLEGDKSAFDIAAEVNLDFQVVLTVLNAMKKIGLIENSLEPWN